MNIVYLLTNKSKQEGKRFYVGSKSECKIVKMGGIDTMVSVKDGKPYFSSSTSFEFKDDLAKGHIFEVSVLEVVPSSMKKSLIEIENKWIVAKNAVLSDEYYNLAYATTNMHVHSRVVNRYGQTIAEYAHDCSNVSKRDGNAKELGFSNFGLFCFDAYAKYLENGKNWAKTSYHYGKYKNFVRICLSPFDMEKAIKDLETDKSSEIRKLLADKCSLRKACEILDIEVPAGRVMLGDYIETRSFSVACLRGKTKEELEVEITKMILDGKGFREVSNELGIVYESVKRYFFRCVRKRLKSSDL